ncbi:MAG: GDP-mannose 4,6-dehydratase, partial [Bdellovibrionales bacterium]|nr:GDP-mannose 4,6-dehydratase [Bdellovibrionales bacterium]
ATGVFNIGTGIETSVNELYSEICKSLDIEKLAKYAEHRPGDQLRSSIDASLAKEKLGWEPKVNISEGFQITAEWNRSQICS